MAHGGHGQWWLVLACVVAVSASTASAFVFKAGGTGEWRVPASGANESAYIQWARHTRFRVGDAIAFTYQPGNDSVLLVDQKAYDACDTGSPVDKFDDGNTVVTFTRSGPFYFISGNKDNCKSNEKLIVVVMGERAAVGALAPTPINSPFSPPPPSGIEISPAADQQPTGAASPKAAGIAGAAALALGTMLYALV